MDERYRNRCEKLCFRCMAKLDQPGAVCPHCGYDNSVRINEPGYLQETVLRDQYYIGKALGRGGFGVTYAGFDFNLDRRVAVKEFFPAELALRSGGTQTVVPYHDAAERFERGKQRALDEGRLVAKMEHVPNVVRVFNVFAENGTVYIVMEYVDGMTLAQIVRSSGRMEWQTAYAMLRPVMAALEALHGKGIIHRDVSPDNIMLLRGTQSETVLLDFGVARSYEDENATRSVSLRPGFTPVEQYNTTSPQDGRVDEYALCATMYYLITGIYPTMADQRTYQDEPMPTPRELGAEIPEQVEAVLLKGMAIHAKDRYDSIATLRAQFEAAMKKREPFNLKKLLLPVAVVLLALVVTGFLLMRGGSKPAPAPTSVPTAEPTSVPTAEPTSVPTAEPTSVPTAEPTSVPAMEPASALVATVPRENVLMTGADPLLKGDESTVEGLTVFGSSMLRSDVGSVTFRDSLSGAPGDAWDVSADKSGAVLAWAVRNGDLYDLTIAGEGGVRLNEDSRSLFQGYTHMTRLDFGGCVDTSGVRDMGLMFCFCEALTTLDVSGFDTSSATGMFGMFNDCRALTTLNVSGFDTRNVTDMRGMFSECYALTALDVSGFDTGNVTDMSWMFNKCEALRTLDVSGFETDGVTDMSRMFNECKAVQALDVSGFDTHSVMDMSFMFNECEAVQALDVSGFDTSNVDNMYAMFSECYEVTTLDLSGFDTHSVTDMGWMFSECYGLTALDVSGFDTSRVTDMSYMFNKCEALRTLDVSGFDTGNATNMSFMFNECETVQALDVSGFDTRNVGNMYAMFSECYAVTTLDLSGFDTSRVTDMSWMFSDCEALTTLDLSGFDMSNVTETENMFTNCPAAIRANGRAMTSEQWLSGGGTAEVPAQNVLMTGADPLLEEDASTVEGLTVFGSSLLRSDVGSVTFKASLSGAPGDAWDVSADGNGAVLAWAVRNGDLYDLTIAGEGGVRLNEDSSFLFQGYTSATEIDFGGCVDTSGVTSMNSMFDHCSALTALDVSGFDTSSVQDMGFMFNFCEALTALDLSAFDTSGVRSMSTMFQMCSALATLNVSGFDTGSVTNIRYMFNKCGSLTALDVSGFDTGSVTDMSFMFNECGSLTALDVSGFDTSRVTNMKSMFDECSALTALDVSGFDTGSVTDMSFMFDLCESLTALDVSGFDTSDVTNMGLMFNHCESLTALDVSGFDTGSVTDMYAMFNGCSALTALDVSGFDTGNVTDMSYMFNKCGSLTALNVSGFDTGNVTDMRNMFNECKAVKALDVSEFDTRNVTNMYAMFSECYAVTTLDVRWFDTGNVTDMSWMFSDCEGLTTLDLSGFDVSGVTESANMFTNCPAAIRVSGKTITSEQWLESVGL